jgi:endoglucanase
MDPNSAADADQDTALALLFGAKRWGAGDLRGAATAMLADIWRLEVARVGGSSLVSAGSWAVSQAGGTVVNPSYLAPYAYRAFAKVDGSHPWADLVPASYRLLRTASTADLGGTRSAGLPPNWCVVDGSGTPRHYQGQDAADDYGYDAFRVPWRVAVDWSWNRSPEARDYLGGLSALRDAWSRSGSLAADYHRDGSAAGDPDPAAYGADLGAFMADPRAAADLLKRGLMSTYHSEGDSAWWGDRRSYYAQNWAWFGVALAAGRITDLSR